VRDAKLLDQLRNWTSGRALVKASDAPLSRIVHLGGCDDRSYSYDAEYDGRPNGALTYESLKLLRGYKTLPTYSGFFRDLRKALPNDDYPQTPHLNARPDMKQTIVFS
jgi:hypothetical protein